ADGSQLRHAGNLRRETNAARAMDTPRHDGLDQRSDIFLLDRALVLLVTAGIDAVSHRLVLQIAFAALIADRAVERMVDQQEFHHAHGARRLRLWDADDLDETHAAIAGDRQTLVETEARNFRARSLAGLEQCVLRRNVDLFSVDNDLGHATAPRRAGIPIMRNDSTNTA